MKKREVSVLLVLDNEISNYQCNYEPIAVFDIANRENIRSAVVDYFLNFNYDEDEIVEWIDEIVENLFNDAKHDDIEGDIYFKLMTTDYYL